MHSTYTVGVSFLESFFKILGVEDRRGDGNTRMAATMNAINFISTALVESDTSRQKNTSDDAGHVWVLTQLEGAEPVDEEEVSWFKLEGVGLIYALENLPKTHSECVIVLGKRPFGLKWYG